MESIKRDFVCSYTEWILKYRKYRFMTMLFGKRKLTYGDTITGYGPESYNIIGDGRI